MLELTQGDVSVFPTSAGSIVSAAIDSLVSFESVPCSELTLTQVDGAWKRELFEL